MAAAMIFPQFSFFIYDDKNMASIDEEDEVCPGCLSSRTFSPNMKLLVSPCCHKLCESCVKLKFSAGTAPCPVCGTLLRKSDFIQQTFEDLSVEKEVRVRKRVLKLFNKREQDFASLREYNDYLEEVEDIIFNLVNGVNVASTNSRIESFKKDNEELIKHNHALETHEAKLFAAMVEKERHQKQERDLADLAVIIEEKETKTKQNESLINELAKSSKSADTIISLRTTKGLKASSSRRRDEKYPESTEKDLTISFMDNISRLAGKSAGTMFLNNDDKRNDSNMPTVDDTPFDPMETCYQPQMQFSIGPLDRFFDPALRDIHEDAKAGSTRGGGFSPLLTYERAVSSAFTGLLEPQLAL